jgi:hypothetical protein
VSDALVGGVTYSSNQGSTWDVPGTDAPPTGYAWFCPFDVLAKLVGTSSQLYQFWCANCGYSAYMECQLWQVSDLLTLSAPSYPCLDSASLVGIDICEILYDWLFSSFWASVTGLQEAQCTGASTGPGPPPPPAPPPGGGGG